MRNTRPACVAFLVLLYNWWTEKLVAHAAEANITVDDTDPSILYLPSGSWHSNSVPCSFCLNPDSDLAFEKTYHDGTHIIPTIDDDDQPTVSKSSAPQPTVSAQAGDDDDEGDDKGGQQNKGNGKGGTQHTRRQGDFNPFATSKFDADDAGFVDTPVFAQFNFTGSAIYLYCIVPQGVAPPNTMPTTTNLSFTLDGQSTAPYIHTGSPTNSGFLPNVNVFFADGLANEPHSLRVDIGIDSVFLFDYLVYTQVKEDIVSQTSSAPSHGFTPSTAASNSDSSEDEARKRHNIATFAGAVGGSVGVLGLFALGLAISIYYRRVRSARRQRRERDRESYHTNSSEDSPPMQGPAPFVPRYFPGTVPAAPPPYVPSTSSSSSVSSPVTSYMPLMSSVVSQPTTLTYADVPPATPLPEDILLAEELPTVPPPSFGEAIASPRPSIHLVLPSPPPPPGIPSPLESTSTQRDGLSDNSVSPQASSSPSSERSESPSLSNVVTGPDDTTPSRRSSTSESGHRGESAR